MTQAQHILKSVRYRKLRLANSTFKLLQYSTHRGQQQKRLSSYLRHAAKAVLTNTCPGHHHQAHLLRPCRLSTVSIRRLNSRQTQTRSPGNKTSCIRELPAQTVHQTSNVSAFARRKRPKHTRFQNHTRETATSCQHNDNSRSRWSAWVITTLQKEQSHRSRET